MYFWGLLSSLPDKSWCTNSAGARSAGGYTGSLEVHCNYITYLLTYLLTYLHTCIQFNYSSVKLKNAVVDWEIVGTIKIHIKADHFIANFQPDDPPQISLSLSL